MTSSKDAPGIPTLVLTRAAADAAKWQSGLAARTLHVRLYPCIEKRLLPDAPERFLATLPLERWSDVIVTSSFSAACFLDLCRKHSLSPKALRTAVFWAVGAETARVLNEAGIPARVPAGGKNWKGLRAALPPDLKGRAFLLPGPLRRPSTPERDLVKRGARVQSLPLYETVPAPGLKPLSPPCSVLCFASPSAVTAFCTVNPAFRELPVIAIGLTTAAACRRFRFRKILTAASPDLENIRRKVAEALSKSFKLI